MIIHRLLIIKISFNESNFTVQWYFSGGSDQCCQLETHSKLT